MEFGEKLRQARLEAGLSQRQLCGDVITRNMLSLIENGAAQPSMDTLKYLAARLNKPVSYFLEEEGVLLPNLPVMEQTRAAFDRGDHSQVLALLEDYQGPDPVFDRERAILQNISLLSLARQALAEDRLPYARELLRRITPEGYLEEEITLQKQLLLAQADPGQAQLPDRDGEWLLRARHALAREELTRAAAFLDAMNVQDTPDWFLLRGEIALRAGAFASAAELLHRAENAYPQETAGLLEACYRELGDYKQAYFYACKQR